jgi:hypothetical protein
MVIDPHIIGCSQYDMVIYFESQLTILEYFVHVICTSLLQPAIEYLEHPPYPTTSHQGQHIHLCDVHRAYDIMRVPP